MMSHEICTHRLVAEQDIYVGQQLLQRLLVELRDEGRAEVHEEHVAGCQRARRQCQQRLGGHGHEEALRPTDALY